MSTPRLSVLFLTLAIMTSLIRAEMISASDPKIQYEGRVAVLAGGSVKIGFPGVAIRFVAEAQSLAMRCSASSDTVFIDLSIDGAPHRRIRLAKGPQDLALLEKVPGKHSVELIRRNESWQGTLEIAGFLLDGGVIDAAPALPDRKLLFIGDSVTCGEGTDIRPGDPAEGNFNASGRHAFGRVLGRRLQAQVHLVSYGGRGIIRDWQGIRATNNAPQFYDRVLPDEAEPRWDASRYVPDLVAIGLGTNDFNPGIPDEGEFVSAYVEFVKRVLKDAPKAQVLLLDSPIVVDGKLKGQQRTVLGFYLDKVVERLGDSRVRHATVSHYPGRPENAHPVASEHEAMANELEPVIRAVLGWR